MTAKLSERLNAEIRVQQGLAVIAKLTGEGVSTELILLLREAAELARRVESAPTGKAFHYSRPPTRGITGVTVEGGLDVWALSGRLVALVPMEVPRG